jgi:hypothetical protein
MLALAFDAGRRIIELPMLPAKEKKVISRKMLRIGLNAKQARRKGTATAKARAKARRKENSAEIGIGKVKEPEGTLGNHLVPTIAKEMVIASGETTVVSLTTGLRGGKEGNVNGNQSHREKAKEADDEHAGEGSRRGRGKGRKAKGKTSISKR